MSSLHALTSFFFALSFVLHDNIYCPRSNDLDRFKYSHMREHLTTIYCQAAMSEPCSLIPKPNSRLFMPQTKNRSDLSNTTWIFKTRDGLNNDAPVAWDGTGLTSDQFAPDGS